MSDLVVRPYTKADWCLQLRRPGPPTTEYVTLCRHLNETEAREIIDAGAAFWLFGDPARDREADSES